jgi:hypothetical protein
VLANLDGELTIEGTRGFGDDFMVGRAGRVSLPTSVLADVHALYRSAAEALGPVRMEWVHDGDKPWVVQFHRGASPSAGSVIYPGDTSQARRFSVTDGLEALRRFISETGVAERGLVLVGDVGVTSHFGDVLRKARIPSIIESA